LSPLWHHYCTAANIDPLRKYENNAQHNIPLGIKQGLNSPLLRMRLYFRVSEIWFKSMSTQKANTEK